MHSSNWYGEGSLAIFFWAEALHRVNAVQYAKMPIPTGTSASARVEDRDEIKASLVAEYAI